MQATSSPRATTNGAIYGGEIEAEEAEEQQDDNQAHLDLIAQQLTPITETLQQFVDDRSPLDPEQNEPSKKTHSSTPVAFEANAVGELELAGEDNTTGNRSVNAQFCKASDEIGTNCYEKEEVSGQNRIATVRARAYFEDMPDRKRLIEPVKYKLDATQIAESSSTPKLNDRNKRPAVLCSFFSKGWCIKGKSCRFLHIKDGLASKCKESVANAAKKECEHFLGKADSSLEENSALDDGEILKQKNDLRGLLKGDPGFHVFRGHERWPISSGGQKMSSLSTSWKRDPSQIQKCLASHAEYQASETSYFHRYSLESSGSGSRNHPTNQNAEYNTRLIGNWEPSIPFRPSHIITQRILSGAKICDRIHDSAEQTQMRDKFSQCEQDAFGESNNVYAKPHVKAAGTFFPGYGSGTSFISGSNFYSKEIQKDSSNIQCVNAETTAEKQRSSLLIEKESSLNSTESRTIVEADMEDVNDSEPCTDRQSHTTLPKIDSAREDNYTDVDLKSDANAHKESKGLKIFHAALVERVKELLRHPWRDGLLRKDVYKLIVKKTVDKVISTMEPHQIPANAESIEQYFLVFNGKLTKLVEAYVDKYGKPVPG
ncbi:hypothetical protein LIER_15156 [Lithospermum erythrorhizon]|uniref:C3H1-type domain-containing protein n=1 Tax=Lithospermum erythrorhizon TaxID=34254 RepID=A0AAV3Q6D0_LITER